MLRAKFFASDTAEAGSFEAQINDFLEKHPNIDIIELNYNSNLVSTDKGDGYRGKYSALLIYRIHPSEPKPPATQ